MRTNPQFSVTRGRLNASDRYDRLVAVIGYEERSTRVLESFGGTARQITAFDYENQDVLSYNRNKQLFASAHSVASLPGLVEQLRADYDADRVRATSAPRSVMAGGVRWLVDISSMDRDLLATIIRFASDTLKDTDLLRFVYSPAAFSPELQRDFGTIRINRPVLGLEGWPADPSQELHAVVGLGFERTLALAAVETLEPGKALYFHPRGFDLRYDTAFDMINRSLFISEFDSMRSYQLAEPLSLYSMLENYASAMANRARIVFVPLGPKLFALASMLVAVQYPRMCSVWRVSPGLERLPSQRVSVGELIAVDARVGVPAN